MSNSTADVSPSHPFLLKWGGQLHIQLSHIHTGDGWSGQKLPRYITKRAKPSIDYAFAVIALLERWDATPFSSFSSTHMNVYGWESDRMHLRWPTRCNVSSVWHPLRRRKLCDLFCRLCWDHINVLCLSPQVKSSEVKGHCDSHQCPLQQDALQIAKYWYL